MKDGGKGSVAGYQGWEDSGGTNPGLAGFFARIGQGHGAKTREVGARMRLSRKVGSGEPESRVWSRREFLSIVTKKRFI